MSFDDFIFEARNFVVSRGLKFYYNYNPIFRTVNLNIACPISNRSYLLSCDEDKLNENFLEKLKRNIIRYFFVSYKCNLSIEKVIFNDPATIILWTDGSKTVVKAQDGEVFDPEKGMAMAISKKFLGNNHEYFEEFKKWVGRYEKQQRKNKDTEVSMSYAATALKRLGKSLREFNK